MPVTIAHRRAIDVGRARSAPVPTDTLPDRPAAAHADPLETRDPDLWSAAATAHQATPSLAYHHIGGLPFAEIAELLGIPRRRAPAAADGLKTLPHYREDESA